MSNVMEKIGNADNLIKEAKSIIDLRYKKGAHSVGAALRTKSGKIYTGISIKGLKLDLCSEWTAIGRAFVEGETEIESIVAVHRKEDGTFEFFPPCGLCRELLTKYCPDALVIFSENEFKKASDLLPSAWKR
ncbi:MAG: cytidine deaminase [Candidatus Doudnabacteria bacterium]|nr:cytidine deaminase [Candidatus Doudnabacteria bacterium]